MNCSYQFNEADELFISIFSKKWRNTDGLCYIPEKIETGGWGHGISGGLEKKKCRNSRGQLKKKWKFQGYSRKTNGEFPWVLVLDFGISKGKGVSHKFAEFPGVKAFFLKISRGAFQKSISSTPSVWIFSGIAHWYLFLHVAI